MTYRSKYHGRYSGIGTMLQRPWIQRACRKSAVEMKGIAEGFSPTGDPQSDPHPGLYRKSFDVVPIFKNVPFRGKPRMRAGARLVNTAPHASIVEHGNGKTPRYAVLSKSIDVMKAAHRA
ncbi:hypothetical protein PV332_10415 [Streptomyces scabiei]|uniref:hypothetical protein n=1 Tax=Streptomyces scabiei TaxID=1930 RepID=UPI0029B112C0|nr:hypothetical protein [Streptomyces scabiei]MDX2575893.1 hypothetical protein [Streptomyces scabiei]MDX2885634.1 hypothetical protein [Streptomyces scabiei]MDX2997640.1 hypothetical protein [Streptomyces scabiei]MDX3032939.1 hypothetical protein [Streptomyces scabiei]MDX3051280.1 hypothetical protein [Streptomyces scabiei]